MLSAFFLLWKGHTRTQYIRDFFSLVFYSFPMISLFCGGVHFCGWLNTEWKVVFLFGGSVVFSFFTIGSSLCIIELLTYAFSILLLFSILEGKNLSPFFRCYTCNFTMYQRNVLIMFPSCLHIIMVWINTHTEQVQYTTGCRRNNSESNVNVEVLEKLASPFDNPIPLSCASRTTVQQCSGIFQEIQFRKKGGCLLGNK